MRTPVALGPGKTRGWKHFLSLLFGLAAAGAGWFYLAPQGARDRATPEACLALFREALVREDVGALQQTLTTALRQRLTGRLTEWLQDQRQVRSWSEYPAQVRGRQAEVLVDEVLRDGRTCRVRYQLEQEAGGWRICQVERLEVRPSPVPPGTRLGEEPPDTPPSQTIWVPRSQGESP
jgi:hypothetical protein